MKAKILLTGLVAPLMFAACTQEEAFVPQQEAGKIDLSNRPTLGKVTLGFGNQTRAELNQEGFFNSLKWTDDDAIGARIIDTPTFDGYLSPFKNYTISSTFASTNYKYEKSTGAEWTTDALMVEGNYMFYAPYDGTALYRDPLKITFPVNQTVNPNAPQANKAVANTDAIDKFFRDNATTTVVGYKFLAAKGQEGVISPEMTHLYAYPQITLKNTYTEKVDDKDVAKPITITKIVLESANFYNSYKINQQNLVNALKDELVAQARPADGKFLHPGNAKENAGDWRDNVWQLQYARTADIAAEETAYGILDKDPKEGDVNGKVTITFEPALQIAENGEFKFHVVLPAEKYSSLTAKVYTTDNKAFVENAGSNQIKSFSIGTTPLTYAPGKRYATQEYDFKTDAEGKVSYETKAETAGELATFTISGYQNTYEEPVYIQSTADLEREIKKINNNEYDLTLASSVNPGEAKYILQIDNDTQKAMMTINSEVVRIKEQYLKNGTITFDAPVNVEGDITLNSDYTFKKTLTQKSGTLTLDKVTVEGAAEFNGKVILNNGTKLSGSANKFKAAEVNNAIINGTTTFRSGEVTIKAMTGAGTVNIESATVTLDENGAITGVTEWTVKTGHLKINKAGFNTSVVIGTIKDDKSENAGTLTVTKPITTTNVKLNSGTFNMNNTDVMVIGTTFCNNWKFGKVVNNGKLSIAADGILTVKAGNTFEHNGVDIEYTNANSIIVNNGTINNNAILTVDENSGEIVTGVNSRTYVTKATAGKINNQNLAYVKDENKGQVVYYTFTEATNVAGIESKSAGMAYVTKLIFNKEFTAEKAFDSSKSILNKVNALEFKKKVNVETVLALNVNTIDITGDVTFQGTLEKSQTGIGLKKETTINVASGKKLTVAFMTFAPISDVMVNVNLLKDSEGNNQATWVLNDADFGYNGGTYTAAPTILNGAELKDKWLDVTTAPYTWK